MTAGDNGTTHDYLLDTSVLSRLIDPSHKDHATVIAWEKALPQACRRLLSVVAVAELRFGLELARLANRHALLPHLEGLIHAAEQRQPLPVTPGTALYYAQLKSAVVGHHLPKRLQQRSNRGWGNPESWTDEFTGDALQIQENDLWQAAQAIERDVIFVVADRRMERIAAADGRLRLLCLSV